jgi:peptidoglycan hydrolase-like protein with peptidoglycan-binding domain
MMPVKKQWVAFQKTPKGETNMRRIVLITALAFIAGLFTVSQGLGAGEYEQGASEMEKGATEMQKGGTMEEQGAAMEQQGAAKEEGAVAAVSLDSSQISEMQKLLQEKGYDPGTTDGVMGEKTQEALRNFQEAQGLAATGEPDEDTLRALAPDAETQEMFGLSPEFNEEQNQEDGGNIGGEPDTEQPSGTY